MKRVVVISLVLLWSSVAAAKTIKIGVVNVQRAVAESKDGKSAERRLTKLKKKKEAELNRKLKGFYEEEKKLRNSWAMLKDAERRRRAASARKRMERLKEEYIKAERMLAQRQARVMVKITKKINNIIRGIAKRDGYDYIFANAAVLWAPNHVDLTNEVIRRFNK